MRSLMQSVKRKVKSEQQKENWDAEGREKEVFILNEDLPVCRASRTVDHSVVVFNLPKLREVPENQQHRLLVKKLRLCSYVFEFGETPDSPQEAKEKELKRAALLELVNHFQVYNPSFTDTELTEVFSMLRFNLFRPLPPNTQEALGDFNPEEDEPQSESSWPHLQVVYEFLHRLAASRNTDPELLNKYFNPEFILNLLELFDSEDPRERDYLKTILHRIYGNFMNLRPFIRRAINNVFYSYVYESDRHNGIAELLEIIGSIINGFAIPLKNQHKVMLERVLLPIHKATHVSMFHAQLSYCVTQFLEKDPTLAPMIVRSLLKLWPHTCSKKEIMFLNEIEEILERVQAEHLEDTLIPLFQQIALSIRSPHFQVSERAIYILSHDVLMRFVTSRHRDILIPLLTEAMFCNSFGLPEQVEHTYREEQLAAANEVSEDWRGNQRKPLQSWMELGHWNSTIVDLTLEVLKLLQELDHDGLDRCSKLYNDGIREKLERRRMKREKWESLDRETNELREQLKGIQENPDEPADDDGSAESNGKDGGSRGNRNTDTTATDQSSDNVTKHLTTTPKPPSSPPPLSSAAPAPNSQGLPTPDQSALKYSSPVPQAAPVNESDLPHSHFSAPSQNPSSVPLAQPLSHVGNPQASSSSPKFGSSQQPRPPVSPPPIAVPLRPAAVSAAATPQSKRP